MKVYRVHYTSNEGSHGYAWFPSRREAKANAAQYKRDNQPQPETGDVYADMYRRTAAADDPEIEPVTFATNKASILDLLNSYASHPNNG